MATETKKRNGKATVAAEGVPKIEPMYRIGRIWEAEAAELLAAFNARLAIGLDPKAALEEVACDGKRRPEVIANSALCPWAHGIIPVKAKREVKPKEAHPGTPPALAPEVQLILDQSNQYIKVLDQLQMLSTALVNFREALALITDPAILQYGCTGAGTLVAMQAAWLPTVQLPRCDLPPL